jgi:hypothetical protein
MITLGPSLTGLGGTQVTGSITYTLVSVRAIQEEVAGFLLDEIIAPTGEYHRQYDFGKS